MDYSGKVTKIKFDNLPSDLSKIELDGIEYIVQFPDDWEENEGEK